MSAQPERSAAVATDSEGLVLRLQLSRPDFRLDLDIDLPAHGVTVLFGPSGSGKTTVLRCVAGLERATGVVRLGQTIWQDSASRRWVPTHQRDLGYVFQEASLFEHLSVWANLRFGVERVRRPGAAEALDSAIALLGIGHLLHRDVASLSGGERQRVAIARALATQPRILLMDEPLASLDVARRQEILPWLERLNQEAGIPMLYVTHTMEELTRVADHVVLLESGRVVSHGPMSSVLSNPRFAASVGSEAGTVLRGRLLAHEPLHHLSCVEADGQQFWVRMQDLPIRTEVRLHVQANDISLALCRPADCSIQNMVRGTLESIHRDRHPASCLLVLRLQDQRLVARITQKSAGALGLREGSAVWALIKSVALTKN